MFVMGLCEGNEELRLFRFSKTYQTDEMPDFWIILTGKENIPRHVMKCINSRQIWPDYEIIKKFVHCYFAIHKYSNHLSIKLFDDLT